MDGKYISNPLFIIGNPRSGTTLIRLMLTCHSKISIPPECGFVLWLYDKYFDWKAIDNDNSERVLIFLDDLFKCNKFENWGLNKKNIHQEIIDVRPNNYASLCELVYNIYGRAYNYNFSVWGDKNNYYLNCIDKLYSLFIIQRIL